MPVPLKPLPLKPLTDNDKAFTDRFSTAGERKPTGNHVFDKACAHHGIEHRLIKPRRPQTNGMVERFNGRISEVLATTRFDSAENLEQTLLRYGYLYNQHIPQRALEHKTPLEALKDWQKRKPELFHKQVRNHAGPDTYGLRAPECHLFLFFRKRDKNRAKNTEIKARDILPFCPKILATIK